MFDWLFGNSRKDNMSQYQTERDNAQIEQQVNDFYKTRLNDIYNNPENAGLIEGMRKNDSAFDMAWQNDMKELDMQSSKLGQAYSQANDAYTDMEKKQRHNYFGDGLLGALLNPLAQTGTAVGDLVTGNYKDRDAMSDIGAAGQTLLTLLPGVGLAAKGLGATKLASGLGNVNKALYTIPGSMGTGAAFGGLETLRQGGQETDLGEALRSAGTGAAFGFAIPAAMQFGGKALRNRGSNVIQNSLAQSGVGGDDIANIMGTIPNKARYQEALRSFVPKSAFGKLALGGGALYGGSQLMGAMNGGGQAQPTLDEYYAMQSGGYY